MVKTSKQNFVRSKNSTLDVTALRSALPFERGIFQLSEGEFWTDEFVLSDGAVFTWAERKKLGIADITYETLNSMDKGKRIELYGK